MATGFGAATPAPKLETRGDASAIVNGAAVSAMFADCSPGRRRRDVRADRELNTTETVGQSFLSAVIGRTFAARRAGMIDAVNDEIARMPVAAARVTGSSGLI